MELNRLFRVIRARWLVVVTVAIIGFASAFAFTTLGNRNQAASYAGTASIRFDPLEGENVDDLVAAINDAHSFALLAAENLLAEDPNLSIAPDATAGRLVFTAIGDTREEAMAKVDALVNTYRSSTSGVNSDVTSQMEEYEQQAASIAAQMADLQPQLTPEERALAGEHDTLDLAITRLREQIVTLMVEGALGAPNEAGIAALNADLDELNERKANLPPRPEAELDVVDKLRRDSLQRQLDAITLEYQRLALRSVGVLETGEVLEPTQVVDRTPPPDSPLMNGIIGLLGGGGLAIFALVVLSRSRREVWVEEDPPVPVLAEIPDRRVTTLPGPTWYDSTDIGARKEGIQASRTAIEASLHHERAALAIVGDHVSEVTRHALAADLAIAFASAGRSVLLVGGDFAGQVDMTEFDVGEPTLSSVLRLPMGVEFERRIARMLDEAVHIRSGLAVMPAGPAPESPADSLAGPQFRRFLELVRERFDLVAVVGGEAEAASTQVIVQRTGNAIVVVSPGATTVPRLNSIFADMRNQSVVVPGVMMIWGKESRVRLPAIRPGVVRRPQQQSHPAGQPLSRLEYYPFPGSKSTGGSRDASLDQLAEGLDRDRSRLAEGQQPGMRDEIGMEIVETLANTDPALAYDPVAHYVVARVEDMMTAVAGQTNVTGDLIDVVTTDGFIPLCRVKGTPSIGERLVFELEQEVGKELGASLASQMSTALNGSQHLDPAWAINSWIRSEFFGKHLARTDREPEVWHLTSPEGTVQILVTGRRLSDERLAKMTSQVVRRIIHDLETRLKEAQEIGDRAQADALEAELKDAHLFEVSLGLLRGGGTEEARLTYSWRRSDQNPRGWNPVWSEGIRPNIAPLQRLGLLPEPVLTDEELSELLPTG